MQIKERGLMQALILALGIVIAGLSVSHAIKYFRNFDRYVEVKGFAEKLVKSNKASWQIGFSATADDLKTMYANINKQQQIITDFLLKNGFTAEEIANQPVSIYDNSANNAYPLDKNSKRPLKYAGNAGIDISSVNVDAVAKAVQLTNQLIEQGVVLNNNNAMYMYTDLNSIKPDMLDEALANARVSADRFAKKSDSKLGKIRHASQGLFSINAPDPNLGDMSSINKKVRVVTTVQFFLH